MSIRERWIPIPGCPGYEVSDYGRVRSDTRQVGARGGGIATRRGRLLSPVVKKRKGTSYLQVSLVPLGGVRKEFLVHRLVLIAFLGYRPKAQTRHLNGDPHDNRLVNLAWGTAKENSEDRKTHGTFQRGSRHWAAKINEEMVRKIRKALSCGLTKTEVSRAFSISYSIVRAVACRASWRHI